MAGDAPSFSALRLSEGGPRCARAFFGILAKHYLHSASEKPSAIEVQLSTRASAFTLRSVGVSVGPNVTCELAGELGQGDFELAAQPWIAAQSRCFERVLD